jgi:nitrogen fixation NifU-like protein
VIEDLYRTVILEHYQSPRNRGVLPNPTVQAHSMNPLCGDEMSVTARIEGDRLVDAAYEARGCSISHASADMMADLIKGKTLAQVSNLCASFRNMMEDSVDDVASELGDLTALQSVRKYPVRIKCALLPWNTLIEALRDHPLAHLGEER